MHRYRYAGQALHSEIELPELVVGGDGRASLSFHLGAAAASSGAGRWLHSWKLPDGRVSLSIARAGTSYLLRFPELAEFLVEADGARVAGTAAASTSQQMFRHLLLDQVLPRALSHRGQFAVHASAARSRNGFVAFLGQSGTGKSTLAASLRTQDSPFVADDGLVLQVEGRSVRCTATYPGMRLLPDAARALLAGEVETPACGDYSAKRRIAVADDGNAERVRLARIFVLGAPNPPGAPPATVERLSARAGVMELVRHSFQLDPTDRAAAQRTLDHACRISSAVPVLRLVYRREHHLLPEVHAAIDAELARAPTSGAQAP